VIATYPISFIYPQIGDGVVFGVLIGSADDPWCYYIRMSNFRVISFSVNQF